MSDQSQQIADHFFRHEAGNLRAALTRVLGLKYLDLCEDIVQEAMLRALKTWPVGGVPPNPSGWIFRTARNIAIDHIRRDKLISSKVGTVTEHFRALYDEGTGHIHEGLIADNLLRMVFTCCDLELSPEARVVLTLKIVCSFHNREIASALLKKPDAVEKMVGRGKKRLQQVIDLERGLNDHSIESRLPDVLQVIYLLFNEGYKASRGPSLIKFPLCLEAIRLARLLSEHPLTGVPITHALTALLLFHAARFPSRIDEDGQLLPLEEQDRSEWSQEIIGEAQRFLNRSATGTLLSDYHLLAGIAACHAFATDYASTNWSLILDHYDLLAQTNDSPVILLNRIVAMREVKGEQAARAELDKLETLPRMGEYYLFHMVKARVLQAGGRVGAAVQSLSRAHSLANNAIEKQYIQMRIEVLKAESGGQ